MGIRREARILTERCIEWGIPASGGAQGAVNLTRSVTVNLAESPLGWLFSRGLVTQRQFDAGERLRADWERVKDDVMREAVRAKFTQNQELYAVLLATGDSGATSRGAVP